MQAVYQISADELVQVIRQAVREELKILTPGQSTAIKPFNKKETAAFLKVSLSTVERLIKSGQLQTYNIGKRILIKEETLLMYLSDRGGN